MRSLVPSLAFFAALASVLPASAQPIPSAFRQIVAGSGYSCALTAEGEAWCWGGGEYGILGTAARPNSRVPIPIPAEVGFERLVSGNMHVCGLTPEGEAWCWGDNRNSLLGARSGRDCSSRHLGRFECARRPIRVGGGFRFAKLAAGGYHTCGLAGRAIFCWGSNNEGQLGDGTTRARTEPVRVASDLDFDDVDAAISSSCGLAAGRHHCWGLQPMAPKGDSTRVYSPVVQSLDSSFSDVIPGSCGLVTGTTGGWVSCNGSRRNESGIGSIAFAVTFDNLALVRLSTGSSQQKCGLTADGIAYCWKLHDAGGGYYDEPEAPRRVSESLKFIEIVTGGDGHSCGLTAEGRAYCWGYNDRGQLGNGTTQGSLEPLAVTQGSAGGVSK